MRPRPAPTRPASSGSRPSRGETDCTELWSELVYRPVGAPAGQGLDALCVPLLVAVAGLLLPILAGTFELVEVGFGGGADRGGVARALLRGGGGGAGGGGGGGGGGGRAARG